MDLPKISVVPKLTQADLSKKGFLNAEDIKKIGVQFLVWSGPVLISFFTLLQAGVPFEKAWPVLVAGLYGLVLNYLKKLNDGKN